MIPFQQEYWRSCPKCERVDWGMYWQAATFPLNLGSSFNYNVESTPEHIALRCGNCGYSLRMETADAKVPA